MVMYTSSTGQTYPLFTNGMQVSRTTFIDGGRRIAFRTDTQCDGTWWWSLDRSGTITQLTAEVRTNTLRGTSNGYVFFQPGSTGPELRYDRFNADGTIDSTILWHADPGSWRLLWASNLTIAPNWAPFQPMAAPTTDLTINDQAALTYYRELTRARIEEAKNTNATTLYFRDFWLDELPPEIGQLTDLETLDLWRNGITSLPPEIGQLSNLRSLRLNENCLTNLPPELGQLSNLVRLDLSGNQLTNLPPELGQLTNLTKLHWSDNPFEIPVIETSNISLKLEYLRALATVDEAEVVARDPAYVIALARIQAAQESGTTSLDLSDIGLTELPPEIGQLTELEALFLVTGSEGRTNTRSELPNELISLPPEIGQLANLQILNVSSNSLTSLPPEIGQLANLKILYLANNNLMRLPSEISQLQNLEWLFLDNNALTELPPEIVQLKKLHWLDLSGNSLTSIPPEIGYLTNLQGLNLDQTALTGLPLEIGQLTNLQTIGLPSNILLDLPPELEYLRDLERPHLIRIPEVAYQRAAGRIENARSIGANSLNLDGAGMIELPPEIGQLTHVQSLGVSGNDLTSLPPEIGQLTTLQLLTVSGNDLTSLPPEFGQLINLQTLHMGETTGPACHRKSASSRICRSLICATMR